MRRRHAGVALLACGVVVLGGCGSSDDTASTSTASSPEPPASAETQAPPAPSGKAAKASIEDFTFTPKSVTVPAGGTVTWTDEDSANHNVAFDDKRIEGIDNLREGQSGKVTFAEAGTYAYVCTYHPGMEGKVIVK